MENNFQIGQTYGARSICDHDCIFQMNVVGRTEKTVSIEYRGQVSRKKIHVHDGVESVKMGNYSMAASWYATSDENGDRRKPAAVKAAEAAEAVAAIQHETGTDGRDHFIVTRRGCEYTAVPYAHGWELRTRRLALGARHIGGCRVFRTVEELAAECSPFAGLPAVWRGLVADRAKAEAATMTDAEAMQTLAKMMAGELYNRLTADHPDAVAHTSARDKARLRGWGVVDGGKA